MKLVDKIYVRDVLVRVVEAGTGWDIVDDWASRGVLTDEEDQGLVRVVVEKEEGWSVMTLRGTTWRNRWVCSECGGGVVREARFGLCSRCDNDTGVL